MTGDHGEPLLVLDRAGKGRVAQLLSDQMWLWARGFEGGGPQAELLRRLAYWLTGLSSGSSDWRVTTRRSPSIAARRSFSSRSGSFISQ